MTTYNPGKKFRVSSEWSPDRKHPVTGKHEAHRGQDWAAPAGTDIPAAEAGKVVFKGNMNGYGNTVILEHNLNGKVVQTLYAHMQKPSPLKVGDTVKKGQSVGPVGNTGNRSKGNHVHFEILEDRKSGDGTIKKGHASTDPRKFSFPDHGPKPTANSTKEAEGGVTQIVSSIADKATELSKGVLGYWGQENKEEKAGRGTVQSKGMPFVGGIEKINAKGVSHFQEAAAQTTYGATLWQAEGGGAIGKVNTLGYAGKYQFGRNEVTAVGKKLGYVDAKGNWVGKNDIKSKADWLKNGQVQDEFLKEYTKLNWQTLQRLMKRANLNLKDYIGKKVAGITITESGLLAASHLAGAGSVGNFLKSNGERIAVDGSGKKMTDYLSMGANKDVSSITGNPFEIYKDIGKLDDKEHKYNVAGMSGLSYTRKKDGKKIVVKVMESENYQQQAEYAVGKMKGSQAGPGAAADTVPPTKAEEGWVDSLVNNVEGFFTKGVEKNKAKKASSPRIDPKKADPKKVEPKKVEPKKVEPKKVEPKKVEPKKVEPKKVEPKKVEPNIAEASGRSESASQKNALSETSQLPTEQINIVLGQLQATLSQLSSMLSQPIQITVDVQNGNIVAAVNAANSQQQRRS
ncbi:M23 family metallopeptidase [Chromobacterium aquaticum]|uniref:Peptidoglycan DD-metalloendopeptidase family protein n=1 Tax=Chromobacterium aquaticum TaxID=467180 RepID=A0ABV8ZNM9_9NEIS|nr:peptidoglycan DD-metalloendopeptidase family protein [Chromobacterium aquaticum]MCD5360713.1 peptidoglycan DD-metalloendopeptidase family protein [Chromobacterium aquaticum]